MPLDWEESDPRYITNAADVKLRAFSTKARAAGWGAGTVLALWAWKWPRVRQLQSMQQPG